MNTDKVLALAKEAGIGWGAGEGLGGMPEFLCIFAALIQQQMEAENAELRKDAERYRWLRERNDSMTKEPPLTVAKVSGWGLDAWSGDDLDAAIDRARSANDL